MAADPSPSDETRPVLVWDGECEFCRRCVLFLESRVGDAVETVAYQDLGERFPDLDREDCEQAVHLVEPDGTITRGAEASFRALALAPGWGFWRFLYRRRWGFRTVSEWCYSLVAKNRIPISRITRLLAGPDPEAPTWVWSRRIFLSLLGVVYLIAFTSFWVQADLLVGSTGIFPLEDTFARWQGGTLLDHPTLFWISQSDAFLHMVCAAGVALAALLSAGLAPRLALIGLWLLYLSLTRVGDIFMGYQWESLLLETGFLAIFLAPGGLRPGARWELAPSTLARLLLLWLLFRLLFRSGVVKIGGETWDNLTALQFHYWTQPLPTWTSYYVDSLPNWMHSVSTIGMFAIELVLPFLIFGPRRLRKIAFLGSAFLQLAIMATGNYGFFNLNTLALCVLLLDDQTLARVLPRSRRCFTGFGVGRPGWTHWAMPPFAALMVFLSVLMTLPPARPPADQPRGLFVRIHDSIAPFQSVNRYGLFARMTTTRPELTLQGSDDGMSWHTYEFHWKPGRVDRRPAFVQPHMPRVDWQMWFSALDAESLARFGMDLSSPDVPQEFVDHRAAWMLRLLRRVLEGNPYALELFANNPFPDAPPKYLQVGLDEYRFADGEHRAETGNWWIRNSTLLWFIPPVELVDGQLQWASR